MTKLTMELTNGFKATWNHDCGIRVYPSYVIRTDKKGFDVFIESYWNRESYIQFIKHFDVFIEAYYFCKENTIRFTLERDTEDSFTFSIPKPWIFYDDIELRLFDLSNINNEIKNEDIIDFYNAIPIVPVNHNGRILSEDKVRELNWRIANTEVRAKL